MFFCPFHHLLLNCTPRYMYMGTHYNDYYYYTEIVFYKFTYSKCYN